MKPSDDLDSFYSLQIPDDSCHCTQNAKFRTTAYRLLSGWDWEDAPIARPTLSQIVHAELTLELLCCATDKGSP